MYRYYDYYQYQHGNVDRTDVVEEHLLPVLAIGFFTGLWGSFLRFDNILNIIFVTIVEKEVCK